MVIRKEIIFGLVFVALVFLVSTGLSLETKNEEAIPNQFHGIYFKDGLLSVSVTNQNFKHVIEAVSQKVGIEIVVPESIAEKVTVVFENLPIEEGFKKLLKEQNHVFMYSRPEEASGAPSLSKILIFPGSKGEALTAVKPEVKTDQVTETQESPSQQIFNEDSDKLSLDQNRRRMHEALEQLRSKQPSREANQQLSELLSPNLDDTALREKVYDALLRMEGIHREMETELGNFEEENHAK